MSTHKIIENAHVRIDEFAKKSEEESCKEPKDYRRFIYYEPDTLPITFEGNIASPPKSPKSLLATELQLVQPESQSQSKQPKLQSEGTKSEATELLPEQTKSEEPESHAMELELDSEVHNENNKTKEPILEKYVRRHHAHDQIIGDKLDGTMTRNKLKGTCLLLSLNLD